MRHLLGRIYEKVMRGGRHWWAKSEYDCYCGSDNCAYCYFCGEENHD